MDGAALGHISWNQPFGSISNVKKVTLIKSRESNLSNTENDAAGSDRFFILLHVDVYKRQLLQNAMWDHNSENQDIVQQIKEYVAANYMNDVTIAEMGNRFDISPSYISRIFRNKTGEKYIDFVTGVRMKKAMELIRMSPALSVKEVACLLYTSCQPGDKRRCI